MADVEEALYHRHQKINSKYGTVILEEKEPKDMKEILLQ